MPTPNRSAKKKKYTPPSPQSAKSARAARANKRAPASQSNLSEAEMASARVDDDIHVVNEEDGNNSQHIEPNVIINPSGSSSDPRPDSGFNAGASSSAD
jgi:K+-transporting ATPase c subunit